MQRIYITSQMYTEVDDEDVVYLCLLTEWYLNKGYIKGTKKRNGVILMHIEIAKRMGLNINNFIDHKDRNKLNNRRNNLRECTQSQNSANSKLNIRNTTGYKGVSFQKDCNKYRAQITLNGKRISLGLFDSPVDAHEAYKIAAVKLFGEFANFK